MDPTPGVTRDRVSVMLELDPPTESPKGAESRLVDITDTGGYGIYSADGTLDDAGEDLSAHRGYRGPDLGRHRAVVDHHDGV